MSASRWLVIESQARKDGDSCQKPNQTAAVVSTRICFINHALFAAERLVGGFRYTNWLMSRSGAKETHGT